MAPTIPQGTNTYIPSHDATNNMVVDYSRSPDEFSLPEYTQYIPVETNVGRYLEMTVEMAGRIVNANGSDMQWPDGVDAPSGAGNRESFEFKPYTTRRFASPFFLGELSVEQASWDILAQYARIHAQRMMTLRTQLAWSAIIAHSWVNTGTATALGGAKWDVATTANKAIKASLDAAFEKINLATLGAVRQDQVQVVVTPTAARLISKSQEIVDHVKGSPHALAEIEGTMGKNWYGLPKKLYGYPIIVEDAVKVTSVKGATKATSYVAPSDDAYMLSRPGELEGVEGAPSFSTITTFLKEELVVEQKHDRDNRTHKGRICDDTATVVTSGISGHQITDILT
jgi:hypothetical protein